MTFGAPGYCPMPPAPPNWYQVEIYVANRLKVYSMTCNNWSAFQAVQQSVNRVTRDMSMQLNMAAVTEITVKQIPKPFEYEY